jgi:biopolymer transport protein ExbD
LALSIGYSPSNAQTTDSKGNTMGMNVGSASGDEDQINSSINTTPLVDVMLVLLIIFLITIPVVTTSIKVELPKEEIQIRESKPENIVISVNADSKMFMYDTPIKDIRDLTDRLKRVSKMDPQPEVHIRGDLTANYDGVGRVIFACRSAGISKIAFLTEPAARE